jgi:transposase-like protein
MTTGKPRDQHKERQWRRWIRQWQASGLTVRDFCGRHGLAQHCFYAWRRELERRDSQTMSFVPVRIVPDEQPAAAGALEIVLPGRRTLRVAPGFDAATLRQLLAVLEEQPSC